MSSASPSEGTKRGPGRPRVYDEAKRPRQFTLYVDRQTADDLAAFLTKRGSKLTAFVGEVANDALREALDRLRQDGQDDGATNQGAA